MKMKNNVKQSERDERAGGFKCSFDDIEIICLSRFSVIIQNSEKL